jgi:membrane fusion protein, multidrug efflux system
MAANQPTTASSASTPPPSRRRRHLITVAVATLAVVGLATYTVSLARADDDPLAPAAPPAPRVTVAPVEQRLLTEYEELIGRVDALETVEVRARVSGHLESVNFQSGQLVNGGDVLFRIDPRWYRAQADLAAAEVERSRARAEVADREAARAEDLFRERAISFEEADARRSRRAEAHASLLAAQAALASARLDLEHTEVRAPISGRISRAFVTAGNLVSGNAGNATQLTRIVSVGAAYVYADADEQTVLKFNRLLAAGRIAMENGRIPVELQLGDETDFRRRGFLESADNRLDPATGSLTLRMEFENARGDLVPGLFARVRIPISAPQPTLLVSERAIGTDQSQKYVLALAPDNTVAYRTVKVGPSVDGLRIVRDGLQAGDRIIVNGVQRVRPGMTVDPEFAVAMNQLQPTSPPTQLAVR